MNNKRDYYEIHNNNNNNEDDNEDDDYMNFQVIDDNKPNESNCKSKSSTLLNLSKKQKKVLVTNMMENSIKTGLSKAITKQSKGFQLLEKFGYKGGIYCLYIYMCKIPAPSIEYIIIITNHSISFFSGWLREEFTRTARTHSS